MWLPIYGMPRSPPPSDFALSAYLAIQIAQSVGDPMATLGNTVPHQFQIIGSE